MELVQHCKVWPILALIWYKGDFGAGIEDMKMKKRNHIAWEWFL